MGKTADKVQQAKHRENLKGDANAYQAHVEKDKLQKRRKRMADKMKPIAEQEAHKAAERMRVRNYRINKRKQSKLQSRELPTSSHPTKVSNQLVKH